MSKKAGRKRAAFYLRVSTAGQSIENQRLELKAAARAHDWEVVDIFVDKGVSGAAGDREGFDRLHKAIARRSIDLVAASSVDRLGRSLRALVTFLGELEAAGVDLYLHRQGVDTSTPAGKAMFAMLGIFAEFEREAIRERVRAGLARARAQGRTIGRPKISPALESLIRSELESGASIGATTRKLRVGSSTVQRIRQENRHKG